MSKECAFGKGRPGKHSSALGLPAQATVTPSGLLYCLVRTAVAGDVLYHSTFEAVHEIRDLFARAQVFPQPELSHHLEFKNTLNKRQILCPRSLVLALIILL
jgi:hypothetical protein